MTDKKYPYKSKILNITQIVLDQVVKIFPKKKYNINLNQNSKILIIKPDHLGDCLITIQSIVKLLDKYKNIDFVLSEEGCELFKTTKFKNRVSTIRHFMHNRKNNIIKKSLFFIKDYFDLLFRIRNKKYDYAFLMRSQPGNLVTLAFFSQIKCIVGDSCGGFPYMLDKKTTSKDETEHEIDIQKKLLSSIFPAETTQSHSLDIGIWNMHYEIPFDEYILILPNSGDIKKELKPQEWVKKTKFINKNIILTGDKENSELCKLLSKRNNVLNLSMKLKLNNLLKIIVGASHVYCLDSFGGHFSALINKRTDVFIKNDEYNLLRWGPRGKYVKFIR